MSDNMEVWRAFERTDPAQTKEFNRSGGFKGTAVKPVYCDQRMTEMFGPCGIGWGINKPDFTLVNTDNEILVYCTVSIWVRERDNLIHGVGGDKVVSQTKSGPRSSDEAYKMAFTDAIGNAYKHLGMSADIHMGRFDDSKYVEKVRAEMASEQKPEYVKEAESILKQAESVKRDDWAAFYDDVQPRLNKIKDANQKTYEHVKAKLDGIDASMKVAA